MEKAVFYSSGLKFSCKRCSLCCRESTGYVYLSEADLQKLITTLNLNRENFINTYCRWVTDWNGNETLSLKEKSNFDCILWDKGCAVYADRPLQCVTFPFWQSIISSKENWEMAASSCPGMNKGDLHTPQEIERVKELRASLPIISRTGGEI